MEPQQLKSVEAAIGVRFRNLELLKLSLIHSSYINEHPLDAPVSNERLEYLGDALLGMAVANRLYQDYPEMPEGNLTAARAAIVCGECLSDAALELEGARAFSKLTTLWPIQTCHDQILGGKGYP